MFNSHVVMHVVPSAGSPAFQEACSVLLAA